MNLVKHKDDSFDAFDKIYLDIKDHFLEGI